MATTAVSAKDSQDRPEFTSRKVLTVLGAADGDPATIGFWITAYLAAAVHGRWRRDWCGRCLR